ncbi:unnamed protein product [Spodoptera exigua]|nr:unnamed protein product [Spodoptera exigua]
MCIEEPCGGDTEGGSEEMPAAAAADPSAEQKERLIAAVKKEVKQLMEEAVTRKFVHEESGGVTALCGAVEACLGQGLRRRALGLFKTSSTTALLHKIAKDLFGKSSTAFSRVGNGEKERSSLTKNPRSFTCSRLKPQYLLVFDP